jgi:hypothetical protein
MKDMVVDALRNSRIENGQLILDNASDEIIRMTNNDLRSVMLSGLIPHYKVIGACFYGTVLDNYVTKGRYTNRSYAELLGIFKRLIYAEGGGIPYPGFGSAFDEANNEFRSMHPEVSFMSTSGSSVTSSNGTIFFSGQGTNSTPSALIKDVPILETTHGDCGLYLMLREGTGIFDFKESEAIIFDYMSVARRFGLDSSHYDFVPVRQSYDMSSFMTVRLYQPTDGSVKFMYKTSLNEVVLTKIIRNLVNGHSML